MVEIRGWCGFCRRWGIDAGAHQKQEIQKQDCDQDQAADEDVGPEAHDGFVAGKIRGREVFVLMAVFALMAAFVLVFGHAHKLTSRAG